MYSVLLVDDEELERKVLRFTLENSGLPIKILGEAANGREALDKVRLHPDLVIMDIKMPGIDGIEATRRIKALYPGIEVIILTAYGKFSYSQQAIKAQATDYLLKPIQPQQLIQAVKNAIDRFAQKQFLFSPSIDLSGLETEVKALNLQEAKQQLSQKIKLLGEGEATLPPNLLNSFGLRLMVIVIQAALSVGAEPAGVAALESFSQELSHLSSLEEMKAWGEALLEKCVDLLGTNHRNNDLTLVRKAMDYIEHNFAKDISLNLVAEYVHLSPAYFSRIFNKKTGISFSEFVTQVRLKQAKQHLRASEETIDHIALACGFSSSSYFTSVFRKHEGITPSDYRGKNTVIDLGN